MYWLTKIADQKQTENSINYKNCENYSSKYDTKV